MSVSAASSAHESPSLLELQKKVEDHSPASLFVTKEGRLSDHVVRLLTLDHQYDEKEDLGAVVGKTQATWIAVRQEH